jgi:hypothetical protein
MTATMTYTGVLAIEECCSCGISFAMPQDLMNALSRDHDRWFYCPQGHRQHYVGETDEQKLRRQLEYSRNDAQWYRDQLHASERSKAALKGHLTRARNKIANGVCPVGNCRRHFDNVQAHIASEHPTWSVLDPETGKAATL